MKYKNAVVGQRVQIKKVFNSDNAYFSKGQVGVITRTDGDESDTKFCWITLDGKTEEVDRAMYPRQLRKVKGNDNSK